VGWDWVHLVLRPLFGLLYQPQLIHDDVCGATSGMRIGRGHRSTWRKTAPVPLCPPQIPHDLTRARTRAAAVKSRRLTASTMARPWDVTMCWHLERRYFSQSPLWEPQIHRPLLWFEPSPLKMAHYLSLAMLEYRPMVTSATRRPWMNVHLRNYNCFKLTYDILTSSNRGEETPIKLSIRITIKVVPFVSHGCETWSLTYREEHSFRMF
jgi:hypothetical protein